MRVTVDGWQLDLEVRGPESAPALVFVHGLTTDRRLMLDAFEPAFETHAGWRRIYLDLPGHGATPAAEAAASADALLSGLTSLVREHAGLLPGLVAHSYGTYLALGMVNQIGPLAGLFLTNPIVEPDVGRRTRTGQRISATDDDLAFADDEERQTFYAETTRHTADVLDAFRRVVDPAHRAVDRAFLERVRARYVMSVPWSQALHELDAPVHVVCGQDDYWSSYRDAIDLVDLAPRCRFTVLPGCGPLLPLERGPEMRELFSTWLGELEAALSRRY